MKLSLHNSYKYLITSHSLKNIQALQKQYHIQTIIYAAGGLVLNPQNEILFIYRNNHWELPKGWIEKGESQKQAAIREVSEECNIFDLQIQKRLPATFHIYQEAGSPILKITYWFLMMNASNETPAPQAEEGISKVQWLSYKQFTSLYDKIYPSIRELLEYVIKNSVDKFDA